MTRQTFRFCPQCGTPLAPKLMDERERMACPDAMCGFVHWNNPTPVVAAVVEHEGQIVLARNALWKVPFYALITGFLEAHDISPEDAVAREVKEELNLDASAVNLIGHYRFERQNQLILAFHVPATGVIQLDPELSDYIKVAPKQAQYWPAATGLALRDWLISQGHSPEAMPLPQL